MKETIHVFADMDGVLTNWEGHFEDRMGYHYLTISRNESYKVTKTFPVEWWGTMPWMEDGKELWKFLSDNFEDLHILTAPTQDSEQKSEKGKHLWLKKEGFIEQLGIDNIHVAKDKHLYVKEDTVSILVDDTQKKIDKWRAAGGIGILHTDTESTILELKKHLTNYK
jgi:hypothetical protein